MNICLVGLNNNFVRQTAKDLAAALGYKFVDLQTDLNKYILKSVNYPLAVANELLSETETALVKTSTDKDGVVVYIPNDTFLSNENYRYVRGVSFAITELQNSPIKQNLQNLISSHCLYRVDSQKARQKIMQILSRI